MSTDKEQYKVHVEPFYQAQGEEVALYEAAYAAVDLLEATPPSRYGQPVV